VYLAGYAVHRQPVVVQAAGVTQGGAVLATARPAGVGLPAFSIGVSLSRLVALLMSVGMVYMFRTMG
jgi:hypothetical protein